MPLSELATWDRFDQQHHLPDRTTEIQLATIGHILACVNSKHPERFKLTDFMPSCESDQRQTPEEFMKGLASG